LPSLSSISVPTPYELSCGKGPEEEEAGLEDLKKCFVKVHKAKDSQSVED